MKSKKSSQAIPSTNPSMPQATTVEGIFDLPQSGTIAYVIVQGNPNDIVVKKENFNSAMQGDKVLVQILSAASSKKMKKEGRVIKIINRKQKEFLGEIIALSKGLMFQDVDKALAPLAIEEESLGSVKAGDKVVVKISKWSPKNKALSAEIIDLLVADDDNDAAMKTLLLGHVFPIVFPKAVEKEANSIPDSIAPAEIKKRRDIRTTLTFTVDPEDAKDFDDAISFEKINEHCFQIGVHIADVSHYVLPETALNEEAYLRATSVYLPDRVNPMLPERISNLLCSLRPHEEKLCFSVIYDIDAEGKILKEWIGKTIIKSDHRFTYEALQVILDEKKGQYIDEILWLYNFTDKLRKERFKNGSINFSSKEYRFRLDEKNRPVEIILKESSPAHHFIEELMLLANKTIATFIDKKSTALHPIAFPYRVHDEPDFEKLRSFASFAKKFGYKLDIFSPEKLAESFNKVLEAVQGKPEQQAMEQMGMKAMAKAIYTTHNIGHFGLGFPFYCHFTSPIRRYPDVMVHRIVYDILQSTPTLPPVDIEQQLKHCTDREKAAMECERSAIKYKQVEFMQQYVGQEFSGVISGLAHHGLWVETLAHKVEGFISIQHLSSIDNFKFIPEEYCIKGETTGLTLKMGDAMNILIRSTNLEKKQIEFEWITPVLPTKNNPLILSKKQTTKKSNIILKRKND